MQKLFILINKDLDLAYQGVQGGHAAVQWVLDNKDQEWNNGHLIFLESNKELEKWETKFQYKGLKYSKFIEPDIGNVTTALAVLLDSEKSPFKHLKLIGSK